MIKKRNLFNVIEFFNENEIHKYTKLLEKVINEFLSDYLPEVKYEEFICNYTNHESITMKIIAYRFYLELININFFDIVISKLVNLNIFKKNEIKKHPVFYLRISSPDKSINSLLESQPHYDRSYNLFAYSYWLALKNINQSTGGLCFFNQSSEIKTMFEVPWGEPNRFNFDKYYQSHNIIDPIIRNSIIHPNLRAGKAYMFDSNVLHGATKPLSDIRISFDFRFLTKNEILKANKRVQKIINFFNDDPCSIILKNLLLFGDEKILLKYNNSLKIKNDIKPLINNYEFLNPNKKIHWSIENSFIT